MSVDNYITLNQLKKTTEALLIKINEDGDTKVSKTSVQAALAQGVKIATIGDIDLYAPYSMSQEQVWQAIQEYLTYNYSSLVIATFKTYSNGNNYLDYTYDQLLSLLFGQHVFVIVKTFDINGYYDSGEFVVSRSGSGPILYPNYHVDDGILLFSCVSGGTYYCLQVTSSGGISYSQNPVNEKADWEQINPSDGSYILNKPAIKAGDGQNGIIQGLIEDTSSAATYTLLISGDAGATTYTYTTEDTLPTAANLKNYGLAYYENGTNLTTKYHKIIALDKTNQTITFSYSCSSTAAIVNGTLLIYTHIANKAEAMYSHAEGEQTFAMGNDSHAQGAATFTGGLGSHAEGYRTESFGMGSHSQGTETIATDSYSHAEGKNTQALSVGAHAEGLATIVTGYYSHAQGSNTIANHASQNVFGEYNIEDPSSNLSSIRGNYIQIVGNGTSTNRSNARTLDWSGNEILSGKLTVGADPIAAMDVVTKQYFETNVSTLIQAALAEYGDGDTASYGYPSVNGVEF